MIERSLLKRNSGKAEFGLPVHVAESTPLAVDICTSRHAHIRRTNAGVRYDSEYLVSSHEKSDESRRRLAERPAPETGLLMRSNYSGGVLSLRDGRAPSGGGWIRWRSHPLTGEDTKPTNPSHDQAHGGRPAGPRGGGEAGEAPEQLQCGLIVTRCTIHGAAGISSIRVKAVR